MEDDFAAELKHKLIVTRASRDLPTSPTAATVRNRIPASKSRPCVCFVVGSHHAVWGFRCGGARSEMEKENASAKEGSLAGHESLYRLLAKELPPHLFQVRFLIRILVLHFFTSVDLRSVCACCQAGSHMCSQNCSLLSIQSRSFSFWAQFRGLRVKSLSGHGGLVDMLEALVWASDELGFPG